MGFLALLNGRWDFKRCPLFPPVIPATPARWCKSCHSKYFSHAAGRPSHCRLTSALFPFPLPLCYIVSHSSSRFQSITFFESNLLSACFSATYCAFPEIKLDYRDIEKRGRHVQRNQGQGLNELIESKNSSVCWSQMSGFKWTYEVLSSTYSADINIWHFPKE